MHGRLLLVERVQAGRPVAHIAAEMGISRVTAHKWVRRRRAEGEAGLHDRSSRPHTTPHRTPAAMETRVCGLRTSRKLGPARIGPILGLSPSTVHHILARHHLNRLAYLDRPTGLDFIHSAVDDHTRPAYSEIHPNEKATTYAAFLRRAAAFFTAHGIERVLTDNAFAYRKSFAWKNALNDLNATGEITRIHRPQTNGKVERFNPTLADEWAYNRPYTNNDERTAALQDFPHTHNHHRSHTALGGQPPTTRVNNPADQYT